MPLGRGLLGVRALELGFPVPEQAGVFLVRVVPPEVLERVEVVGRGLNRNSVGKKSFACFFATSWVLCIRN